MPLFAKGGLDSFNIAGHKIPIQLLGGLAAVAGVLLIIRARQSGSNVASVGTAPSTTVDPSLLGFGTTTGSDFSAQLANITQQLTALQQSGNTPAPTPQSQPAPTTVPVPVAVGTPVRWPTLPHIGPTTLPNGSVVWAGG